MSAITSVIDAVEAGVSAAGLTFIYDDRFADSARYLQTGNVVLSGVRATTMDDERSSSDLETLSLFVSVDVLLPCSVVTLKSDWETAERIIREVVKRSPQSYRPSATTASVRTADDVPAILISFTFNVVS